MTTVSFTPQLRQHVDIAPTAVTASTVREALNAVFAKTPRMRSYVLDDRGALRKHVTVVVDGNAIMDRQSLADVVTADGEVYVMQALSGG